MCVCMMLGCLILAKKYSFDQISGKKAPGGGGFSWLPLQEKQGYLFEYVRTP